MSAHHHVLDTAVVAVTTIISASVPLLLADASSPATGELQLLLLPLIGALIVSGGMIMLNPQPETRRIVMGRGIFALFIGTLAPQLMGMVHPSLASLSLKPAVLLMAGGVVSGMAYVLSRPFVSRLYERAAAVAQREVERIEQQLSPSTITTVTVVETKPTEAPKP